MDEKGSTSRGGGGWTSQIVRWRRLDGRIFFGGGGREGG